MKKILIKAELNDLFTKGFLNYENFNKYWNTVKFLSKKDTDLWFNELMAYAGPEVRVYYNK